MGLNLSRVEDSGKKSVVYLLKDYQFCWSEKEKETAPSFWAIISKKDFISDPMVLSENVLENQLEIVKKISNFIEKCEEKTRFLTFRGEYIKNSRTSLIMSIDSTNDFQSLISLPPSNSMLFIEGNIKEGQSSELFWHVNTSDFKQNNPIQSIIFNSNSKNLKFNISLGIEWFALKPSWEDNFNYSI